jgi:hypothetical protein
MDVVDNNGGIALNLGVRINSHDKNMLPNCCEYRVMRNTMRSGFDRPVSIAVLHSSIVQPHLVVITVIYRGVFTILELFLKLLISCNPEFVFVPVYKCREINQKLLSDHRVSIVDHFDYGPRYALLNSCNLVSNIWDAYERCHSVEHCGSNLAAGVSNQGRKLGWSTLSDSFPLGVRIVIPQLADA